MNFFSTIQRRPPVRKVRTEPRRTAPKVKVPSLVFFVYPDGREVCAETAAGRREYKRRREVMAERQQMICPLCSETLMGWNPTTDHEAGRGFNGARRDDRTEHPDGTWMNAAVHGHCNREKGSKRYCWVDGVYATCSREE